MDISPYVEGLRRDLLAAADAAGPEARAAAERLSYALDPAARLSIMEAVSQAAAEITAELPAGSVDVHLNGRDLEFGVHLPAPTAPAAAPTSTERAEEEDEDEGAVARITLRLPEGLKTKAEELAARSGHSLNTWLVNVIRAATRDGGINVDVDLSSLPQFINDAMSGLEPFRSTPKSSRRMTGWL